MKNLKKSNNQITYIYKNIYQKFIKYLKKKLILK